MGLRLILTAQVQNVVKQNNSKKEKKRAGGISKANNSCEFRLLNQQKQSKTETD